MPTDAPRAAQDRWCDAEGTRIALFSWVEQVAEHSEHGALFSRLHQRGRDAVALDADAGLALCPTPGTHSGPLGLGQAR